jgi:hypothetical protein
MADWANGAAKIRPGVQDPQNYKFQFKTKAKSFEWGGMWPDGGADSPPENRPRMLINARLRSGRIGRRGGQIRLSNPSIGGTGASVVGLRNFEIARPYSLYYVQDGCPSASSTVGFSVGAFDYNQTPFAQPLVYYSAATNNYAIAPFSDNLYGAKDDKIVEILLYRGTFDTPTLDSAGNSMERQVFELENQFTHVTAMQAFNGSLFIMAIHSGGAGSCKVLEYDGVTVSDDLTSANVGTGFGLYRESLILGYGGSPNYLSLRDVEGNWTTVSPAAGTVVMLGPHTSVSYKDIFYFAGNTSDVWAYDGTTLAAIATGTTGLNASALVKDVCKHNGVLYVLWEYSNHSAVGIASFDGTTWTPVAKDLKSQFSTLDGVYTIDSFNDSLIVSASTSGEGGVILTSPAIDVVGTYTKHTLESPSGQIFDAVMF